MADLDKLADVAKIPASARQQFFQDVQSAVDKALRLVEMNWSKPATADIAALLKGIAADTQKGAEKLQAIHEQTRTWNKEHFARMALVGALHDQKLKLSISDALTALKTISVSAADAAKDVIKPGRPSGTTERPAFDAFAGDLYLAARQAGGNLTISNSDDQWSGTFLDAFSILKSHLPTSEVFLPVGDTGRVLRRIADQYRRHFDSNA